MFHGNFAGASEIGVGTDELRNRGCDPLDRHKEDPPHGAAASPAPPAAQRATLNDLGLTTGEKARLRVLLHQHGLKTGTALVDAGATGLIVGRNLWQRPMADALAITEQIKELLAEYGTPDGP